MTGQSKTAIIASVAIHAIAFITLMGVKLYYGESGAREQVPVTFVDVKNAKPPRRSAITRPKVQLYRSPQNRSQEQALIRPTHSSSEVFYTDAPEQTFSIARGAEREGFTGQIASQSLPMKRPKGMASPMGAAVLKETQPPETQLLPSRITGGRDFLKEIPAVQRKPSLSDILKRFAQTVRRKIESRKRYPLAARKSMTEGRVGVKMTILRGGQLERTEIIESSGHAILDKAALESVRRSAPFSPLPEEAKRERVQMNIYLVFKMSNG
ncbi:energy transducer TonB [Candidatus Poribacteria bacterium]